MNGPRPTIGKIGQALSFDGVDDNVNSGDVLDMGTKDMTITTWLKKNEPPGETSQYFISKSRAAYQDYRYAVRASPNGTLGAFMQGNTGVDISLSGNINVCDGNWHFATFVFKRDSNLSIYVDGIYDNQISIAHWNGLNMQSNNPFRIGSYTTVNNVTPSSLFRGDLDDVRIYNRALSAQEIKDLYNATKGGIIKQ